MPNGIHPHRAPRGQIRRNGRGYVRFPWLLLAVFPSMWFDMNLAAMDLDPRLVASETSRIAIARKISLPTIAIFDRSGGGGGSGVLISKDGFALTNFHVTEPCGEFMKCGLASGELVDAVIVGIDPTGDVALIQLLGRNDFPTAELGDSDELRPGQTCYAAGNPFLLATDLQPTITAGIISGVQRYQYPSGTLLEYTDCIQVDAAVNPGNSGGPLFDAAGRLVGINGRCSFEKRGRVNVGVAYAISLNQIQHFLGQLKSGRIVDHATLGATVASDEKGHVRVSNILESSDAFRRGLRIDDQISSLGGRPIRTVNAFKNVLGTYPRGWRIPLTYIRKRKEKTLLVRLSGVHPPEALFQLVEGPPRSIRPPDQPDGKTPEKGPPLGKSPVPETPTVRPELAKHFERRHGFANYHYQRMGLDRVLVPWRKDWQLLSSEVPWTLKGTLRSGDPFEIILRNDEVLAVTPSGTYRVSLQESWERQGEPRGSGGLFIALSLWRRLALLGEAGYGEVVYEGTGPLESAKEFEIVTGTYLTSEARWYFDVLNGRLFAGEVTPSGDQDPCELRFQDYETRDGLTFPRTIEVRHAGESYDTLTIESIQTSSVESGS